MDACMEHAVRITIKIDEKFPWEG